MIIAYLNRDTIESFVITTENTDLLHEAIWIDLFTPTKEEEKQVETWLQTDIPTRDEMAEIELSSRLYKDNGLLFMTAMMIAQSDSIDPKLDPITFILNDKQLITIRYIEPQAFKIFCAHLKKIPLENRNACFLLIELMDTCIDRLADIMEFIGRHMDDYSKTIFRPDPASEDKPNYLKLMQTLGTNGDLNTKTRESVLSFQRLLPFFEQSLGAKLVSEEQARLVTLSKDVASLGDHANFLSSKVNFLLDATLGLVNIEQNNIIKIFSVVAVLFLPPTLIASIYGMNFHDIPELSWKYGYAYAIIAILLAAWLPYKYFKYRKWL
jgi:magnesium transporter